MSSTPAPGPGAPFSVPEPPYYTVVFTSLLTADGDGYAETTARMLELVREVPGFLGVQSARSPGGLGITVSYFRDEAAIDTWRRNAEHTLARGRGRAQWYEAFGVHIGRVERSYGFRRPPAT
jgi:heme-degrading monooxygenase HmoA